MQCHAIPCSTMQYHAIPCNTMQYHEIPCNTMQYHAIPCLINNYWRSVPLPCGQYIAIFVLEKSARLNLDPWSHHMVTKKWFDLPWVTQWQGKAMIWLRSNKKSQSEYQQCENVVFMRSWVWARLADSTCAFFTPLTPNLNKQHRQLHLFFIKEPFVRHVRQFC